MILARRRAFILSRHLSCSPTVIMAGSRHISTSPYIKASDAKTYDSMEGKIDGSLLAAIKDVMGFEYMTPVQDKVLNGLPSLKTDCLVRAKTGTGKTMAFLLPAIQSILQDSPPRGQVSVLIISPTRELALQIAAEGTQLVSKLKRPIEIHTAYGGTARAKLYQQFVNGDPKILVATPGRLKDYLTEPETRRKFDHMVTLILDEADTMLDAGFLPDILQILKSLPPKSGKWRGMCFSATFPAKIQEVLSCVLDPGYTSISTIDPLEVPTVEGVPQFSIIIPTVNDTFAVLLSLIKREISLSMEEPKIVVFGITAGMVALYAEFFKDQTDLTVFELHSRMTQPKRTKTTSEFKAAKNGIIFATDVIGRGMDFPDVSLVVQVGLPMNTDVYTHRVGRTARAGKDGRAVLVLAENESFFLKANRQFPIKPYPDVKQILDDTAAAQRASEAMVAVDEETKRKAYSAYLGFTKTHMHKMRLTPAQLVQSANKFAIQAMGCPEVPAVEKKVVGKMGLKGVPGLRYAIKSQIET